jgi:hypothetical protein
MSSSLRALVDRGAGAAAGCAAANFVEAVLAGCGGAVLCCCFV